MLDAQSSLVAGALAALLIATAPEEFGIPDCTTTIEAAGLSGAHRWGIILPNSSRVSMLTYKAIVAVRYPELVVQEGSHTVAPLAQAVSVQTCTLLSYWLQWKGIEEPKRG